MTVGFGIFALLLIVALLLFLGLGLFLAIVSRKTRPFGLAILAVLAVPLLLGMCLMPWSVRTSVKQHEIVSHSRQSTHDLTELTDSFATAQEITISDVESSVDQPAAKDTKAQDRPDWVKSSPVRTGQVHTTAVFSIPCATWPECREELKGEIRRAADEYVDFVVGRQGAARQIDFDLDYILSHIDNEGYSDPAGFQTSHGPLKQVHMLLQFDQSFRNQVEDRWQRVVVSNRLMQAGLGMGAILGVLAVACGYLRLDMATGGACTRRLQFAAVAVILALAVCGVLMARWTAWV